jgi:hypothetical protein
VEKIISVLFALFCIATALLSKSIMGAGLWFWVILLAGLFVGISAYIQGLGMIGAFIAGLLSLVSIAAVLLGLVAATIGGSFRLEGNEAMLLASFFCIALSGLILVMLCKRKSNRLEI